MRNKPETAEMNNETPQNTLKNSAAKVNVNDLLRRVRAVSYTHLTLPTNREV